MIGCDQAKGSRLLESVRRGYKPGRMPKKNLDIGVRLCEPVWQFKMMLHHGIMRVSIKGGLSPNVFQRPRGKRYVFSFLELHGMDTGMKNLEAPRRFFFSRFVV